MKCTLAWPSILGLLLTGYAQAGAVELSVDITPRHWRVNVPGELLFQIKVVDGQLETGGRISVALPGSWTLHALHLVKLEWRDVDLRNRVLRVRESKSGKQRTIPIDDTLYSTLRDLPSRFKKGPVFPEPDGKLVPVTRVPTEELAQQFRILPPEEEERWKIELVEEHFDGTYHRFDRRVILTLLSGELSSGRTVTLEYGTATRPIHSSRLVETISFPISIDDGEGRWRPLQSSPEVTTAFDSSTRQYEVLRRWTPGDPYLRERMVDQDFSHDAFYYVRLRQRDLVDERVVMAWSSPIWIETTN